MQMCSPSRAAAHITCEANITREANITLEFEYFAKVGDEYLRTNNTNSGATTDGGAPVFAGNYQVVVKYGGNANYIDIAPTYTFEVQRRSVTVTAKDQFSTSGSLSADNTFTTSGLVAGHTLTATTSGTQSSVGVGTKTVSGAKVTVNGEDVTANYAFTYVSGRLVVTVVYVEQGTSRDELSGGATTEVYSGGSFTALFEFAYTKNENTLTFDFEQALPAGAKLTLLDLCDGHSSFYYYIASGKVTSISSSEFVKMGTSTATDCDCGTGTKTWQLIVELPNTATGTLNISVKQGAVLLSAPASLTVVAAPTATVNTTNPTANVGEVSTTVTIVNTGASGNAIALKLLDNNGTAIDFPAGVDIKMHGNSPVAVRDGYAFFEKVVDGQYTIVVSNMPTGTYKLAVILCSDTVAAYPMADEVAAKQTNAVSVINTPCAIKATLGSGDRVISQGTEATLTFTVETAETADSIDVEFLKKNGNVYETASGITVTVDGTTVTVNVPSSLAKGTYRIMFKYGTAEYPFNIIVK